MIAALLLVSSPMAHISMNPNYGAASGGYFMATMKIPHGERGMHSTKFVLHVPRGVATVRPEVPMGWRVDMQMYDLPEDQWFVSHGNTVKTAPDTITWTADSFATALDDAHLMNIGLQTKLLCKFNDPVGDDYSGSNSIYQGQYTLWFKVEQHSSVIDDCDADGKNCVTSKSSMWTGALKDNEDGSSPGWNPPAESGVKACPFLFIYAGDGARCTDGDGDPTQPGMSWMGKQIEPTPNQAEVKHEQHVIELATEAALASHESLEGLYASSVKLDVTTTTIESHASSIETLEGRITTFETRVNNLLSIAVAAVALAAASIGILLFLCFFRVANKKAFAQSVAGVPLLNTIPTKSATQMGDVTVGVAA